jgi:asparagine synthase (glutamine-hydrolysing)
MLHQTLEHVVDLVDPAANRVRGISVEEARRRVASGDPEAVRSIAGSFALVGMDGNAARLARSLDRPMRFFLAKQKAGPALVVSDRIDAIRDFLVAEGLGEQFHPSYTRMVPAHHVVEIQLVGCPDPDASHTRFFTPQRDSRAATDVEADMSNLDALGARYVGALLAEIEAWLRELPAGAPVGVFFSGGVDSGAVFLAAYHAFGRLGLPLSRLKAFTLSIGGGASADAAQAREFLERLGLGLFLEEVEMPAGSADTLEAVRVIEDYKPLDVESAAMALALCRGVRQRYPDWKYVLDGDGGDENLKDYSIEENPELTIRSVLNNPLLYQEGWGVGTLKHSRTYSGGLSRACARTWAPLRRFGFEGLSPFTAPAVVAAAEAIPFIALTDWDVERLYALKGDVVSRGIRMVTGLDMPVFPKRRFQHGALSAEEGERGRIGFGEQAYRAHFASIYDQSDQREARDAR